jgi:hypothetical protein
MYYPYFRGKQFELVLLREKAELIASNPINPIIEFVKDNPSSVQRVLEALVKNGALFTVIINPLCGELVKKFGRITEMVDKYVPNGYEGLSLGYIVDANTNVQSLPQIITNSEWDNYTIIHYGYPDGQRLSELINGNKRVKTHIFIDGFASKLYQRHFKRDGISRVLVRDGFRRVRNEDYPANEHFSDLHLTYNDEGMDGFGDFLIVGDEFRENGGPAYAVAIHLTYVNQEQDMYIMHFVSDRAGSPDDPPGKFLEALNKLVQELDRPQSPIYYSDACTEYHGLFDNSHFPGLGYAKKLSMQHHLELMADLLA